ncbi:MAG TPA: AraC family transcriptional regulator [Phototrophicaceae bacterium]|nr:AraC family transcriptional regulator [Phototrophicaceae bacterium]
MQPERLSNDAYLSFAAPFRIFRHSLTGEIVVHWHEFYELALVLSGEGTHILNGTPYPLAPGAVFLLTPTDFHALQPDLRRGTLELYNFIFSDALLSDDLRALVFGASKTYHVLFDGDERSRVAQYFETLWREAEGEDRGYSLMIRAALEQILITLSRQSSAAQPDAPPIYHPAVQKAILYIDHHFREPLSLKSLAVQVNLAPNYLSELFQRATGMPFQAYLQDVRLRFALALLQSSSVSITEVCYISGFNNLSHFTRAFKKKFNYSPRETRRLIAYDRP